MKRRIAMIVALILALGALPGFAAAAIRTTEEKWYVLSHSSDYRVYYYAVVINDSDKPVSVNDLLFEIRNEDDDTIESTAKYKLYPEVLEAGQTGWLVISKDVKDIDSKAEIDHYSLTITSKVNDDKAARPLAATAEFLEEDEDENKSVLRATVNNDGSDMAFEITIAILARDADGHLLYIASGATKDIGLPSGSSLLLRSIVKSDIKDELEDTKVKIATAEAIAYTVEDLDD